MATSAAIDMTGQYVRVADGAGHVVVTMRKFAGDYVIAGSQPVETLPGHVMPTNKDTSLYLEAGEQLFVRSSQAAVAMVTAEVPA